MEKLKERAETLLMEIAAVRKPGVETEELLNLLVLVTRDAYKLANDIVEVAA